MDWLERPNYDGSIWSRKIKKCPLRSICVCMFYSKILPKMDFDIANVGLSLNARHSYGF